MYKKNDEIKPINSVLQYTFLRMFILISTSILIGYTLQPVPLWLNNLFNNSNVFKFIIIFLCGLSMYYPITIESFILLFLTTFIILMSFSVIRKYVK
jgi:hypothetical protein